MAAGLSGSGSEKSGVQEGRHKRDLGVLAKEVVVCSHSRKSLAPASVSTTYAGVNLTPKSANPLTGKGNP